MKINLAFILFSFLLISNSFYSQTEIDTISVRENESLRFNYKKVIIPIALFSYGIIGLESHQIRQVNSGVREEVLEHIDNKITIDDFSQYISIGSLYGLHALGIKGKNNLKDKTIILATSYLLMGLTVNSFKKTAKVERPDGSSYNSFPSGHTATAFMGAELMYQEYKDQSIWYGISGYVIAAGTGAFRMYNNRHWLTDVVAGAGIGIISAKAGYWLYPTVNKLFASKSNPNRKSTFIPYYDGKQVGFGYASSF